MIVMKKYLLAETSLRTIEAMIGGVGQSAACGAKAA